MAKTFGAVLGKQSGRIGQIVGRVTRGKQYFAALPTVAKDRKVSSREQDVRLKLRPSPSSPKASSRASRSRWSATPSTHPTGIFFRYIHYW